MSARRRPPELGLLPTVADRLRAVTRHVPAERVWAVPDCGLWETPRWLAVRKLAALERGRAHRQGGAAAMTTTDARTHED